MIHKLPLSKLKNKWPCRFAQHYFLTVHIIIYRNRSGQVSKISGPHIKNHIVVPTSPDSRHNSVSIVTRRGAGRPRNWGQFPSWKTRFFLQNPDRLWVSSSLIPKCTGGPFSNDEAAGGNVHHSFPSTAEVKNKWKYKSSPHPP